MINPTSLAPVFLFAAAVAAQSLPYHALYPDYETPENCTEFASRSSLGNDPGEILQAGIGLFSFAFGDYNFGGGSQGYIWGFHARIQDQNDATRENIRFVLRSADATGTAPDPTANGVVYRSQELPSRGFQSLDIGIAFGSPVAYSHDRQHFHGVWLPGSPNWPADGLSMLYADDVQGTLGDNPRSNAPGCVYKVQGGTSQRTADKGSYRNAVMTTGSVAKAGCRNRANTRQLPSGSSNYGRGGVWPDVRNYNGSGRYDDISSTCSFAAPMTSGVAALMIATAPGAPVPLPLRSFGAWRLKTDQVIHTPARSVGPNGKATVDLPLGPTDGAVRMFLADNDLFGQWVGASVNGDLYFSNVHTWKTRQQVP